MISLDTYDDQKLFWVKQQLRGLEFLTMTASDFSGMDDKAAHGFGTIFEVLHECIEVLESMESKADPE